MDENQIKENLEDLIDKSSLHKVLELISTICEEKADHIVSNWQDTKLAKTWHKDSITIDKIIKKINN